MLNMLLKSRVVSSLSRGYDLDGNGLDLINIFGVSFFVWLFCVDVTVTHLLGQIMVSGNQL